ncbi:MAG: helix-turn-helix domain-containing protein [Ruminococcus sp.]|nr:helix-turn-helix transcriptional regulator [Ruminococcus sp.]MCI5616658.1 helix-turn-helix domain-containing protein [Ruminococcus sp.]
MTVGERIKLARETKNLSQTDLANACKISKQTLYKYENNIITNIPSDKIEAIANYLSISPAYLMGWETDNKDTDNKLTEDEELQEYLEELKNRSEMRMLFSLAKGATKEDVEKAVKIIEALKEDD